MAYKIRIVLSLALVLAVYSSAKILFAHGHKATVLDDGDPTSYRLAYLSTQDMECEPDQGLCQITFNVVNVDGSNHRPLTNGKFYPLFMESAPDGSHFVFVSPRSGAKNIFVVNATNGTITQVTSGLADMLIGGIGWSPDGENLVFASEPVNYTNRRTGLSEIYTISITGAPLSRITNNSADEYFPIWSPDGQQIAFISDRDGTDQIYVMRSDGTEQRQLTTEGVAALWAWTSSALLIWSPDSQFLLSMRYIDNELTIFSIDVVTGQERHLAGDGSFSPTWSPDGRKIVFTSGRDGNSQIYIMNADGSNEQRLTMSGANDITPKWSPDGKFIAFRSDREGTYELYVMNSDGSNPKQLTDGGIGLFTWVY